MRIIDTHLHLVYKDRLSYPWLGGVPALDRDWTAPDYWAEAEPLGIEAALHMEVDVAEADIEAETDFVTGLDPRIVGAIASGRPESEDFPAYLERLTANRAVKGLRRVLHTVPDEVSQTALFAENIRRLAGHGLPFDICVAERQLPIGRALAEKCPDVQFVLDHCGVPDIAGGDYGAWAGQITAFAALPNVAAKVSGVIAYAGDVPEAATLRPYVEHVIDSFGWDRVVWGSDHPVCTLGAPLTVWVGITRELLAGASEDEQRKLLSANAERIYGLG